MSLNLTILNKLAEQTSQSPEIQQFLTDVFQFEGSPKNGWYMDRYLELLEAYCKKEA